MAGNFMEKMEFEAGGKRAAVYPAAAADRPVVYLNTFAEEGDNVYRELRGLNCPDCTLVAISGLNWDHDMAPWDIPPIAPGDTPCTGGADEYLRLLTGTILPRAETLIKGKALWSGLAGYSLAGLFAVYALYRTDRFSGIASMSGSLWFPEFRQYVFSHEMLRKPDRLYFSLGDRECRTGNPFLRPVQENTEQIEAFYRGQGLKTVFQLNPGNHYKNAAKRTAAGIAWLLTEQA